MSEGLTRAAWQLLWHFLHTNPPYGARYATWWDLEQYAHDLLIVPQWAAINDLTNELLLADLLDRPNGDGYRLVIEDDPQSPRSAAAWYILAFFLWKAPHTFTLSQEQVQGNILFLDRQEDPTPRYATALQALLSAGLVAQDGLGYLLVIREEA
jgi:hypothetical protein